MGKKSKDDGPHPTSVPNRDIIQRLNFLYQASAYLGNLAPPSQGVTPSKEHRPRRQKYTTGDLSRVYVDSMKAIGKKATVKIDPAVKRTICLVCNAILVPGTTATIRVNKSDTHGHIISYTCVACQHARRIPAPPSQSTTQHDLQNETGSEPIIVDSVQTIAMKPNSRKRRRKPVHPHVTPLFARRNAGHLVFRGNENVSTVSGEGGSVFTT